MNHLFEGDAEAESSYGPGTDLIVALLAVVLVLLQLSRANLASLGGGAVDLQYLASRKAALKRELCLTLDSASRECGRGGKYVSGAFELVDVAANQTLRFDESVLFPRSRSDLKPEGKLLLSKVTQVLVKCQGSLREIQVQGHTDETGTDEKNVLLGHLRAMEVLKLLWHSDLDRHQVLVSAASYGREKPVDWTPSLDGRREMHASPAFTAGIDSPRLARNRRVELLLIYKLASTRNKVADEDSCGI